MRARTLSLALAVLAAAACGGDGGTAPSTPAGTPPPATANQAPRALVVAAAAASTGTAVTLDGRSSADPDGDALAWNWTLASRPPGSGASVSGAAAALSAFTPDVSGDYVVTLQVTDRPGASATASVVIRSRRSLQQPSQALAQPERWYSSADVRDVDGAPYLRENPLLPMQTLLLDLNGDGIDDLLTYDSYPLDRPITDPPPSVFIGDGTTLRKAAWTGPTPRKPHAVKALAGDFDNDGRPDVFGLVAIDPPFGAFPDLQDFNHLLWGGATGFEAVTEFDSMLGFWYAGAAGDIDGDGRTDIVVFNFHHASNGVPNRILWNQGGRRFRDDTAGIGTLQGVDQAELIDVDGDGQLDLVIDSITARGRWVTVMWGDRRGFDPARASELQLLDQQFVGTINAADLDGDGWKELIVSGSDDTAHYWVRIFQATSRAGGFAERTAAWIDVPVIAQRFDHLRLADIDHDGQLDLFAPDRHSGIRWSWNGARFMKR